MGELQKATEEVARLTEEVSRLKAQRDRAFTHIRQKLDDLLGVFGTVPLQTEELDDEMLIDLGPIGTVTASFDQVLKHLNKTKDELAVVREDLKAVFSNAGVAILILNTDLQVIDFNRLALDVTNLDNEELLDRHCYEIVCGNEAPPDDCMLKRALFEGKRIHQHVESKRFHRHELDISNRLYDVVATPIFNNDGVVDHMVLVYVDITQRQRDMDKLSASERRLRNLFDNTSDMIQITDFQGGIKFVNRAWSEVLGYGMEQLEGLGLEELVDGEYLEGYKEALEKARDNKTRVHIETAFIAMDGRKVLMDGNVSSTGAKGQGKVLQGFFRNVTRQRRLEEEVSKAQRLESVGFLAGGIAHDFNNILTAVLGNISLAKLYKERGYDIGDKLDKAEKSLLRARVLTQQLLTFAKGGKPVKEKMLLDRLVNDAVIFALSGTNVGCDYDIADDTWLVDADPGQLEQVVHNLVINSVQAMPDGGTLHVSLCNVNAHDYPDRPLTGDEYIKLEIRDEGVGIPEGEIDKVFDPYYSTKDGGSGLGLSAVYSVVRNHGGVVDLKSKLGRGTTLNIFIPAVSGEVVEATAVEEEAVEGRGRILFMDDEASLRELISTLMEHFGFQVVTAADGEETVKIYNKAFKMGRPYDLVVMDLTIPGGMGGKETLEELMKIDPGVRAVVSSGYSNDTVMSDYDKYGFAGVMVKPYKVEALATLAKKILKQ